MPDFDRLPKSYVDTSHGQVHVRQLDGGPQALMLLHWTPLNGRFYARVAPLLAAAGLHVVIPDLLGYGRSDARPEPWTMADYGANLLEVLAALGITECAVLGGHNGASIAIELAVQSSTITKVVLDGVPVLTPELRAAFATLRENPLPSVAPDSSHTTLAWDRTVGLLKMYIPGFEVNNDTLQFVHDTMKDYLETRFVTAGHVAAGFDADVMLPRVTQPVLLLGAEKETLAASFPHARKLAPNAQSHFFAGHHPLLVPGREPEYAASIIPFLKDAA